MRTVTRGALAAIATVVVAGPIFSQEKPAAPGPRHAVIELVPQNAQCVATMRPKTVTTHRTHKISWHVYNHCAADQYVAVPRNQFTRRVSGSGDSCQGGQADDPTEIQGGDTADQPVTVPGGGAYVEIRRTIRGGTKPGDRFCYEVRYGPTSSPTTRVDPELIIN